MILTTISRFDVAHQGIGGGEMYLYFFEDGEIKKGTTFSDDDAQSCDAGILDVIDIGDSDPRQYYDGKWHELESAD
jgi:hypothetical protein